MNGFKRFCLIVFSLAGLLTLTALALPWVGPWTAQAKGLLANGIYFTVLEALFCITALGEDGTFTAVRVDVDARKRSKIKVHARVLPSTSIDVTAKGNELHERLAKGLAAVCGDNISSISLEFEEPEEITSPVTFESAAYDPVFDTAQAALPHAAIVSTAAPEPEANSEITLDMTTFHAPEAGKEE